MINLINSIEPTNSDIYKKAKSKWDSIAKPLDGLGRLEDLICQISSIQNSVDVDISKKAVVIMCADNGIVEEGVTQTGQEVTAIVAKDMAKSIASVCHMAKYIDAKVIPIDIGINEQFLPIKRTYSQSDVDVKINPATSIKSAQSVDIIPNSRFIDASDDFILVDITNFDLNSEKPQIISSKIMSGTNNFTHSPAMNNEQMEAAIITGISIVKKLKDDGIKIIATGEMGIGNTTTATAITCALLGLDPATVTGRGAGLGDEGLSKKIAVIKNAIVKYDLFPQNVADEKEFALKVLQTVGGLDIAGLVGVFLGGSIYKIPIIIDGTISAAAALVAAKIAPATLGYMLPSHSSKEACESKIMEHLGLHPIMDGNFCLGEGSGAVLLFPMLEMALNVYNANVTFNYINVDKYER